MRRPFHVFQPTVIWEVRDGSVALLWLDIWLLDTHLQAVALIDPPTELCAKPVQFFWDDQLCWKMDILCMLLPTGIVDLLTHRPLLHPGDGRDIPKWSCSESGHFSTNSLRRQFRRSQVVLLPFP